MLRREQAVNDKRPMSMAMANPKHDRHAILRVNVEKSHRVPPQSGISSTISDSWEIAIKFRYFASGNPEGE